MVMYDIYNAIQWYTNPPGTQLYTKDNYIQMYNEFITQLCIHAKGIRILTKGCQHILLITPIKLKGNLDTVKTTIQKRNPDYDLVIKR